MDADAALGAAIGLIFGGLVTSLLLLILNRFNESAQSIAEPESSELISQTHASASSSIELLGLVGTVFALMVIALFILNR